MMDRTYSLAERLIALVLAGGVLLATFFYTIVPTRQAFRSLDDDIQQTRERLFRLLEKKGNLEALDQMRRSLAEEDAGASGRIIASNRNLARAAMQSTARKLIQDQGGSVTTVRALVREESGEQRVIVRLQFSITQKKLPHFLVSVANARPFLFVDHMNIRIANVARGTGDQLVAKLDLSAYFSTKEVGG